MSGAEVRVREMAAGEAPALLALVRAAFAYMDGRIDPPSSVHRLTAEGIGAAPLVLVAEAGGEPVGCVLCTPLGGALHLGKLAVRPDRQRAGIGRALVRAAEAAARARGLGALVLETRVELAGNHATFRAMGFRETGRTAHPGFARPTSISFAKELGP